jgi:hypothetical protein
MVEEDLRSRFPNANLIVENRALGGFASQLLSKTAETDLYPFYPDLLIFHVYGSHTHYEEIIRRTREETTAEILLLNDHVTRPTDLEEETNSSNLNPGSKPWEAFMSYQWLPHLADKYGAELCDQRTVWKQYLREHRLEPRNLLSDSVHLNAHGEFLTGDIVKAHLRFDPSFPPAEAETMIREYVVGKDVRVENGKINLPVVGNRIEVITKPGLSGRVSVRINGQKPSEIPELYGFTRALASPGGKWPVIAPISSEKKLQIDDWTMQVQRVTEATNVFRFTLRSSSNGAEGEGRSDERFVSKSGRVVIATNAWNVPYALALAGMKQVPETFAVNWQVQGHFVDEFGATNSPPGIMPSTIVAQGLKNQAHVLELNGADQVQSIRVYHPRSK